MSFACAVCPRQPSRASLSDSATAIAAVIAAMTFSASGAAPTPLYHQCAESFGLTPPAERAGLLSAFYVEGYLSFSLPAVLTGLVAPVVGLTLAADVMVPWSSRSQPRRS
jgi:hypothetical protein